MPDLIQLNAAKILALSLLLFAVAPTPMGAKVIAVMTNKSADKK
jgi:hypothetical protein